MIEKLTTSSLKMGIIAGGQLGKMLIQEASRWDIATYILDPDDSCSAKSVASVYIKGDFNNFDDVYSFGRQVDILTFELENVNIEALRKLKSEGVKVVPDPEILALIQDKGLQKEFYKKHNIPTSSFAIYRNKHEIEDAISNGVLNYPFVQKLRKGGYDGRGVALIKTPHDQLLEGSSIVEDKVEIEKELALIVARNRVGEVRCFPAVEMKFNEKSNLVEELFSPANISKEDENLLEKISIELIEQLDMVGLLAIEFFVDKKGHIFVNEVAPRPHNSGHHTIDAAITSQLKQLLRAILDLPLGSTKLTSASVMLNLLGEEGYYGPVYYEGFVEAMKIDGVKIHLYGKKVTRPLRKMGHVTILDNSVESALIKAEKVKKILKVKSCKRV